MSTTPQAVWRGEFRLFGIMVRCYVLDDGRQIIESASMVELLRAMEDGTLDPGDLEAFARWQARQ